MRRCTTLRRLQLAQNGIGSDGCFAVIEAAAMISVRSGASCGLTYLELSHNPCGDEGIIAGQALLGQCSTLSELVLQNCAIGDKGVLC